MTRAEEAALKAYPTPPSYVSNSPFGPFIPPPEDPQYQREIFVQGYEQAEKDIGWISVNDKLPGPLEWVVACVEVDGICTCLTLATYNEETKEWHTDNWENGEQEVYHPDYWMPIPTKVKEDSK